MRAGVWAGKSERVRGKLEASQGWSIEEEANMCGGSKSVESADLCTRRSELPAVYGCV